MKTVTCFGHTFDVPKWANYVAVDPDGSVWVYKYKPTRAYIDSGELDWCPGDMNSYDDYDRITSVEVPHNDGGVPLYSIPDEPKPINVMLDLETLGRSAGCSVMSIGAVEFSDKLGKEFYTSISQFSCAQHGLFEDAETVKWWQEQSEEARTVFTEPKIHLFDALVDLSEWLSKLGPRENMRIWGNGAAFDNSIVIALYRVMGMELPWNYNGDMCYRTLRTLVPNVPYERIGTYHNALDDAKTQAVHAIAMLEKLGNA